MSEVVLPTSWNVVPLEEVLDKIVGGGTPSKTNASYYQGSIPWMSVKDMNRHVLDDTVDHISEEAVENSSTNIIPAGTPIVATRMSLGKIVTTNFDSAINQDLKALYLNRHVETAYLIQWYRSQSRIVESLGTGTTVKGIRLEVLKNLRFPLAPLAEQKEIAARLDNLLAQVDSIKNRLDSIPSILKRFRQSVLASAVSGKLTEEWREEQSYITASFGGDWKWGPVPSSWNFKLYPDLVESRLGKMLDRAKNSGVATKYLGNINVRWFEFDLDNLQAILVSEKEQVDLGVQPGDVLICEGGEPGRSAIWSIKTNTPVVFQKALHRARVGKEILPEWLNFNLRNDADSRVLEQLFTGTTIKHLTGKALKKYPLRVPPIEEQTEIVRRVEQLFTFADQIEQRVKDAQSRVNNLTQSILAKAFRGELTADWREQNPDLISGENAAEALLERIKTERATTALKKTIKKAPNKTSRRKQQED